MPATFGTHDLRDANIDALVQYLAAEHEVTRKPTMTTRPHADTHTPTDGHARHHAPPPPPDRDPPLHRARLVARALDDAARRLRSALGLVCLVRWAAHWDPIWYSAPLVTVALVTSRSAS